MATNNKFSVVDGGRRDEYIETKSVRSRFGGDDGGSPVDAETKNYLDAKVDAVKAQNDARFTEVLTSLGAVSDKVDRIPKPIGFWALAGMAATGVIALVTIFGVMADRFDGGISAAGLLDQLRAEQVERNQQQDEVLLEIRNSLEKLSNAKLGTSPEGQD